MPDRLPTATDAVTSTTAEVVTITCPRCGAETSVRFYGPCDACRHDLRATLGGEARQVEAAAYEPKMNVTPNAVATKD